ncbi:lymphocyte antigen 6E-like [Leptodactylus fuscus]|uniref:lymphocyte antigen 6E-like n=1 Tax=Leptodactylus fuscus TaxID=238119 RepID=UPI003F4E5F9E
MVVTSSLVSAAYSLTCYTCMTQSSNSDCLITQTPCGSGEGYCRTSVALVSWAGISSASITKTCAAACQESSSSFIGASASVSCCSTDLCNISGGASIKSSYAAILLALGSILIILKSSVM